MKDTLSQRKSFLITKGILSDINDNLRNITLERHSAFCDPRRDRQKVQSGIMFYYTVYFLVKSCGLEYT